MANHRHFYRDLPALSSFADAVHTEAHRQVPDDWWIVVADVIGSTGAIADGGYKRVNTIGVACIIAVLNVDRSIELPFVFGGDGATLAIPDEMAEPVKTALRGVQELARNAFHLELRVGLASVAVLRREDLWVNVTKVRLSTHMNQASLSGRGWGEAERRIKAGACGEVVMVYETDGPAIANFDGFECRWNAVPNFNGHKLSLLVAAMSPDPNVNLDTYRAVMTKITSIYGDVEHYHPLRANQLRLTLRPAALLHEWQVRTQHQSLWHRMIYFGRLLLHNLFGKFLFARHIDTPEVNWSRYRDDLVDNTDFRKFDGMLRMVIDGSDNQAMELQSFLDDGYHAGRLAYGTFKSREALVTCLVQSYNGRHFHFVDGSDGGYALAAVELKKRLETITDRP